ncbi:MAG: electron transport complex subunit RsxC [Clostridia bacterium]|nr:electron transport complex subunit RsxC [Clostridia bacterium]
MNKTERILKPVKRIHGGAFLPHLKHTAEYESVKMPPPAKVYIPLSQHIGAPCEPTVKKGDKVFVGTLIGNATSFISAPIHSSVSGTVEDITEYVMNGTPNRCVVIESDGEMTPDPNLAPFAVNNAADIAAAAKNCGLVGLGGAGFPTHVKLTPKDDTPIDTLVINGAECEPYLTADYRECMESSEDIIEGIYLLKDMLGLEKVIIGVESNKPKAIEKLFAIASDARDTDDKVKLMRLPASYPQGAEKVIIYSATGRVVPPGKLPSDVGCIVMNITSIGTLYRFINTGMPLVSKRVTLEGDAIKEPKNIIVPIGTPITDLLEFAGEECIEGARVIMGGPMMGQPVGDVNAVIEKRTNGILVTCEPLPAKTTACIRCGRCAATCPMKLYPASVEAAYLAGNAGNYEKFNVNYCMECGSCAYVCPARRPLTQVMRNAKAEIRRNKK